MCKLKREVRETGELPRFYGLGYLEPYRRVAICYPIPLNFIVRGITNAYRYIIHAAQPNKFEVALMLAHHRGWNEANANVDQRIEKAVKNAEIEMGKRMLENLTRMTREAPQDIVL